MIVLLDFSKRKRHANNVYYFASFEFLTMSKQDNYWIPIILITAMCAAAAFIPLSNNFQQIGATNQTASSMLVKKTIAEPKAVSTSTTQTAAITQTTTIKTAKKGVAPLNLYFKAHKYQVAMTSEIKAYFQDVEAFLTDNPTKNVLLSGHADDGKSKGWNERVARYRVTEVKKAMVAYGLDENRIVVDHHSNKEPYSEDAESIKNRRVEIRIMD